MPENSGIFYFTFRNYYANYTYFSLEYKKPGNPGFFKIGRNPI